MFLMFCVRFDLFSNNQHIAEDLDFVTIGVGNHFSFKAGQKYKVAKHVAVHLQEKGYLYDRM
jgi:hypothetical protein